MAARSTGRYFTGIIDFDSESAGLAGIQINATVWTANSTLSMRPIRRTGPGSAGLPAVRMADIRGGGGFAGNYVPGAPPIPTGLKYAGGTIKRQMTDGTFISYPVRMSNLSDSQDNFSPSNPQRGGEVFRCTGQWVLAGAVTCTWANGTPVVITASVANDAPTYEGTTKSYDPNGLVTGATQRIDVEGIDDTDVAKTAKMVAVIAAAVTPPMPNLKIYATSYQQAEDDSTGGQIIITWRLQNSVDDIETPRNNVTTDPNKITDQKMLAQVYTTAGGAPSPPSPPSGLKLRPPTVQKLNDQKSFILWTWRRTDTADDVLNPLTKLSVDPADLKTRGTKAVLWDETGSAPSDPSPYPNTKIIDLADTKINDNVTVRVYEQGKNNSKDEIEQGESETFVDPTGITTQSRVAKVDATPSLPAGLVDRGTSTKQLTAVDSHVVNVLRAGKRSTADDITMPRTTSKRSMFGADTDDIAAIVASVATDQTEADTLMAAVAGDTYTLGLSVTSIDRAKKTVVYERVNPGVMVEGLGTATRRLVYAKIDVDGDVNVFVTSNWAETAGYRRMRFSPKMMEVGFRSLIYRRFGKGSTVPDHFSSLNHVCNATFDGMGTGLVIYDDYSLNTRRDLTPRAFFINFHVRYDSLGFVDQVPIDLFEGERRILTSCTTKYGWVKVSAINADIAGAFSKPAAADLSFIYTVPLA